MTLSLNRKKIGLVAGPAAGLLLFMLPLDMPEPAKLSAAIMVFCLVFWVTEAIPLSMTALLGVLLAVVGGLGNINSAFSSLGHPVILLFIGSFLIARAMSKHKLDQRLALYILSIRFFQASAFRLFLGFSFVSFILSMWISNSVTVAMLLPLVLGIVKLVSSPAGKNKPVAVYLLLGIAYSASIGGISTLIGSPPNLIGAGFLQQQGHTIDFLTWMIYAFPVSIVMYVALLLYLYWLLRGCEINKAEIGDYLSRGGHEVISPGERNTLIVFAIVVVLWLLPGIYQMIGFGAHAKTLAAFLPESMVALFGGIILFVLPIDNKQFAGTLGVADINLIDWDTVLLFGGGIALGQLVVESGLAALIGSAIAGAAGKQCVLLVILLLIGGIGLLTNVSSNTAIAVTFIPIVISVIAQMGMPVLFPVFGAILASSLAFLLPIATPPNAIVYGSRLIPITSMMRIGLLLNLLGTAIIFFWVWVYMSF